MDRAKKRLFVRSKDKYMFFLKKITDLLIIINMCFKTILFIKRKQKNYKMIKTRNLTDVESNRYIDRRRRGPS
jgi:hypothetical protein